jgi:mRNA interferase MazF
MKRGEIWTVAGGGAYTGKPRPCVIVQDDAFDATHSITICAFTSDPTEAPLFRVRVEPDDVNGLSSLSTLMVDKVTTVPRDRMGRRVGQLRDENLLRLNQAMIVFLGLARSARSTK